MNFPDLLYEHPSGLAPLSPQVFEDLQLLHFIPEEIARVTLVPCDAGNLAARQEMMRELSRPEIRAALDDLFLRAETLTRLDTIFREARCAEESDAVFVPLSRALFDFADHAASFPGSCALAGRFSSFFSRFVKEETESGYRAALEKAEKVLHEPSCCLFTMHGQSMKLKSGQAESFEEQMEACARDLSLPEAEVAALPARQLSPTILHALALLHPDTFETFAALRKQYASRYDPAVTSYRQALAYYRTMLALCDRVQEAGIPLCYPSLSQTKEINLRTVYDISLLAKNETHIVPNDILFTEEEPFFYLTGANGGGKTTYLRTIGIAVLLFLCGCPVPCEGGTLCPPDAVFTHFPRDERFDGSGRFVEEQTRVRAILDKATPFSLVLLNETYSSTNEENAVRHTVELADTLFDRGVFGLYITHQHAIGQTRIPYLNVLIDRDHENKRTYKVARQKNTGGSFARDILEKYGLTKEALSLRYGGNRT